MRLVAYFSTFFVAHCIVQSYIFWIAKYTKGQVLFNIQFASVWTFWLFGILVALPFLALANMGFSATFYYGYRDTDSAWLVLLTYVAAQMVAIPTMIYLWFHELPQRGPLAGALLCLAGVLVANFWKK